MDERPSCFSVFLQCAAAIRTPKDPNNERSPAQASPRESQTKFNQSTGGEPTNELIRRDEARERLHHCRLRDQIDLRTHSIHAQREREAITTEQMNRPGLDGVHTRLFLSTMATRCAWYLPRHSITSSIEESAAHARHAEPKRRTDA